VPAVPKESLVQISTFTSEVVVIVEAVGSGVYLAPAFLALGYRCVHVSNATESPPGGGYAFSAAYFVDAFTYRGDLDALLAELSGYSVAHVVPGIDTGVELADALAHRLGCRSGNGVALSPARRDKFLMQEAVAKAGLRAAKSTLATTPDELVAWARAEDRWPVVVKPLRSSGTDGVQICRSLEAVAEAAKGLFGTSNVHGVRNDVVVGQEFLHGDEYMVNGVSAQGQHSILEVWLSRKKMSRQVPLYDYAELMPRTSREYAEIAPYAAGVLSALGIANGPSHTEVMFDKDGGEPILIECGARIQGNLNPASLFLATGTNQALATVAAYVAPEQFNAARRDAAPYRLKCRVVFLLSPISGTIVRPLDLAPIKRLASFHSMRFRQKVELGARLRAATDLLTSVGSVHLVHAEQAQIEKDYNAIRAMEAAGLYARALDVEVADAPRAPPP
jgi:biotin carboxylase